MVLDRRAAGLLLHPTSLPGRYGIGDVGPAAHDFVNWLSEAGLSVWQVLPLGPTSFGDSPYQCFSAFAGNPLLVSPDVLAAEGLLTQEDIVPPPFPLAVDYGWVIAWKTDLLRRAHARFAAGGFNALADRYAAFRAREDVAFWLDDYALFMACKDAHNGEPWKTWEPDLRAFQPAAVEAARATHAANIEYHRFAQFLFFDQWDRLRAACRERGITIIGDAPIYVAFDSADTWAHQDLFLVGPDGNPTVVAGVPPDYFSETGQLWGNPIYDWKRMARDDYAWWVARLRSTLALVDVIRLDHFRGFFGYWAVPFGAPTAETGKWVKGPGQKFFASIRKQLGDLPIIAEDLGDITEDVVEGRRKLGLPGMKVLQFAWSPAATDPIATDPNSGFLPYQHDPNQVVYTGTHDNDTTLGWWQNTSTPEERMTMQSYLATDGSAPHWDLMRAAFGSVANTAVIPAQDLLGLGSEARMNFPGRAEGNWCWRLADGQLNRQHAQAIRGLALLYGRAANPPDKAVPLPPKKPKYG